MEEFEPSSDTWNREWKSSSQVRGLESEMEEFEPSSMLESEMEKFEQSSMLGNGNGGVRVKFLRLELGMEEFETSSTIGIGNEAV